MKEKANIESDRLIEMYFNINDMSEQNKGTNPFISRKYSVQCAITDVSNTIEALKSLPIQWEIAMTIKYHQQVKQILEEKLK